MTVPQFFRHFNVLRGYYLATSQKAGYEGDYQWIIELEKGWSTWLPGNEPFQGSTTAGPIRYTLGTLVVKCPPFGGYMWLHLFCWLNALFW